MDLGGDGRRIEYFGYRLHEARAIQGPFIVGGVSSLAVQRITPGGWWRRVDGANARVWEGPSWILVPLCIGTNDERPRYYLVRGGERQYAPP